MILAFIGVNNIGSHNVRTHLLYLHTINNGRKRFNKPKSVAKIMCY